MSNRITASTIEKMRVLLGDRDPKTVRFNIVHNFQCPSRRGEPCLCEPDVVERQIKAKETKAERRMRRRNSR